MQSFKLEWIHFDWKIGIVYFNFSLYWQINLHYYLCFKILNAWQDSTLNGYLFHLLKYVVVLLSSKSFHFHYCCCSLNHSHYYLKFNVWGNSLDIVMSSQYCNYYHNFLSACNGLINEMIHSLNLCLGPKDLSFYHNQ